jgi:outer membrane protein with beta-barrel domain
MIKAGCLSFALCAIAAVPASAQMAWTDQAFANVNFGLQEQSRTLEIASSFELYGEGGAMATTQQIDGGALFDLSGGYKVWKNLAVGLGYSRVVSDADVDIAALVPDPNFFDRPRTLTGVAPGAEHSEHAIHLQGTWIMPVTDKIDVGFSFGPTIFMVGQDLVTAISVTEPTPTLASTTITREDHTTVGINLGVDLNYFFRPNIGAGVLARYTYGSVDLDSAEESLTVGGFQLGFGLRYRFK